ncbi:MAG: phospholipid carrier-dependent glycosyltransferase, partial [Chloroflexota bacterium]
MSEKRLNWAIAILLLAFIILSFAYSVINPLHEATDELRHYRFVQHIVQRQSLPVQGAMACSEQGHHPPLFYATAALATGWIDTGHDICYEPPTNPFWAHHYWEVGVDNKNQYLHGEEEAFPWSGEALAAHLARLVNILFGAGVVLVTYLIGRTIWPTRPYLALGGAAIVAFNPMFLYMAGAINNDVIAALAGAAITLASVRLLRDERGLSWRWGLIFGLLYGLALMSKFNLAAIIVTIELAVTWAAWRKKQWRQWLVVNALLVLVALLIAGWWFVRNQMLYGEPTGIERLTELWGVRDPADS